MVNQTQAQSVVTELCGRRPVMAYLWVEARSHVGTGPELDSLRLLLFWLLSYLLVSEGSPDLTHREVSARRHVRKNVENCIIGGLEDTLPWPGLRWTRELQAWRDDLKALDEEDKAIRNRRWRIYVIRDEKLWKRLLSHLTFSPIRSNRRVLKELRTEILAAWEQAEGRYRGWPVTEDLVYAMNYYHAQIHYPELARDRSGYGGSGDGEAV